MRITKFRVQNHRGFRDSGDLSLDPFCTVIVGPNNAGKSTLLSCLARDVAQEPHASIATKPHRRTRLKRDPQVSAEIEVAPADVTAMLEQNQVFFMPFHGADPNRVLGPLAKWLSSGIPVRLAADVSWGVAIAETSEAQGRFALDLYDVQDCCEGKKFNGFHVRLDEEGLLTANKGQTEFKWLALPRVWEEAVLYRFAAQRPVPSVSAIDMRQDGRMHPDATNLPAVLHDLQGRSPGMLREINTNISRILPEILWVSTLPNGANAEIKVWHRGADTKREDLALSLSHCGSGLGQILAILYVVVTATEPHILLIDEPTAFLHPGAARALCAILRREYAQHQYIVTTHHPAVIQAMNPASIVALHRDGTECKGVNIDSSQIGALEGVLRGLGAQLSDVFGYDKILWVEGPSEEPLFREIIATADAAAGERIGVVAVADTGRLVGTKGDTIFDIYERLSTGNALLPPAVSFMFDSEDLSPQQKRFIEKRAEPLPVVFLKRTMLENYLLDADAVAALFTEQFDLPMNRSTAEREMAKRVQTKKYRAKQGDPMGTCLAGKLLEDWVSETTETRWSYTKRVHTPWLGFWLLKNKPAALATLRAEVLKAAGLE